MTQEGSAGHGLFLRRFTELAPQLEQALALGGGTHTLEDVIEAVARDRAFAWLGERAMLVTTIEVHPRKRVLRYWLAAGDLEELLSFKPAVEAYARGMNCSQVVETGRDGWARALKGLGYQRHCVVLTKELG